MKKSYSQKTDANSICNCYSSCACDFIFVSKNSLMHNFHCIINFKICSALNPYSEGDLVTCKKVATGLIKFEAGGSVSSF
jgi:hypothetical protein